MSIGKAESKIVKKKTMFEQSYPIELTDSNFKDLVSKAEKIREVRNHYFVGIMLALMVILSIMLLTATYLLSPFLRNGQNVFSELIAASVPHVSDAYRSAAMIDFISVLIPTAIITLPLFYLIYYMYFWAVYKYTKLPSLEEQIFSDCFLISRNLKNNSRQAAKNEVVNLLLSLQLFSGLFLVSPNRKVYAPEFGQLRNGGNQISRLIMFSKDDVAKLFTDFGLALVNDDSPKTFDSLCTLVDKAKAYGELRGRFRAIFGKLEQYPVTGPTLWSIIVVVVAIIYFLLSGHVIPIPS